VNCGKDCLSLFLNSIGALMPIDVNSLTDQVDSDTNGPPNLPKAGRIHLVHRAWRDANGQLSIKKVARIFGISYPTLHGRINGAVSKQQAN
jgi:helix-turn-helix, Psq domain